MLVTAETEAAWMGLVAHRFTQIWKDFFICSICLICVRLLLPGWGVAHRLSQIWKDFYLLYLLNLREAFAAWLGVVAHRIHRMHWNNLWESVMICVRFFLPGWSRGTPRPYLPHRHSPFRGLGGQRGLRGPEGLRAHQNETWPHFTVQPGLQMIKKTITNLSIFAF